MKKFLLLGLLFAAFLARAQAQVPNLLNYQGRISVGTTNFTGTGQFRFALTNGDGSTFYWTNDGTGSPSGQQPVNSVSVTVTKGLYSVLLGDTSLPNMTAIPTSVWSNPDVRLRVYFSDGTNASQALSPDQRLAPTGYLASGLTLAGTSTITGDLNLPATTSAAVGVVDIGGTPFLRAYGANGVSDGNTFLSANAGNFTLPGTSNTTEGKGALQADSTGTGNTAAGFQALMGNTVASNNTAVGNAALVNNTTAGQNVALGSGALNAQSYNNGGAAWGSSNTAVGYRALYANQSGSFNTAVGSSALLNCTGTSNTAAGYSALQSNIAGTNNTAVGYNANVGGASLTNATAIGNGASVAASNTIQLGNGSITSLRCQVALTVVSDRNQKENFAPVDGAEVLRKLRGLEIPSWNFIGQDAATLRHYGPMAQDFFAAFGHDAVGVSGNDTTINSGDLAGITLLGVKELSLEQVAARAHAAEQDREITALRERNKAADDENTALKQRLADLERRDREREARLAKLERLVLNAPEDGTRTVALQAGE